MSATVEFKIKTPSEDIIAGNSEHLLIFMSNLRDIVSFFLFWTVICDSSPVKRVQIFMLLCYYTVL